MKSQTLYTLFMDELEDMYSSENQIVESLPKLIKLASFPELKEALSKHLKETQHQVTRIEKIFSLLNTPAKEKTCDAMKGILKETEKMVANTTKNATLDAAIISAAQKVEHYEIASYGTLRSFAQYLELDDEIIQLLQESLNEEGSANKALTKIAEGSLFSSGVNKEAAADVFNHKK
jgi:ferritin-like metal-binding protein YciE